MKPTLPDRSPTSRSVASMREYYSRVLAYIACGASIAAGTYTQYFSYGILWMVPYALLYPHLAYHLGQRFRQHDPRKVTRVLLAVDAVHCGLGMALLGFSVVPSLMFLLVLSFTALVIGGLRLAQVRQEIAREQEKAARLARNLAKYLSPQVWEMIFSGKKSVRLETQRKKLTVFFSDIRGFTELSEELEAEALTDLLNNYLNEMSKIALKYDGTIDKFVGDCVMVFFGDPSTQGAKKDAVAAVSMGIAMRKHMKVLRQQWRAQGITKPLEIRMGINTGYCTVGNFGADTRMDYTIIGREVNLASRLESASEAGEILISHETYSLIKDVIMCRDKGQIAVKGFSRPVQIYQVVDSRRDLGAAPSYVEHELPGFSMYLDTNNIQNYDKERVIQALQQAAERLRDKVIL
ncbi:TPA: adenylate cyclase [Pseudomonas aeruginosa]|nr:adenylate cyclase [Pseudomonas aeruginosa]HCR1487836.1 adenylate cyclase [Pseudomonas aeruginosa]